MYQERAIIELSFGNAKDYPKPELEFDGSNFFIDMSAINRGESQTNLTVTMTAEMHLLASTKISGMKDFHNP